MCASNGPDAEPCDGQVDESQRTFTPAERAIAKHLARKGSTIRSLAVGSEQHRRYPDALVNGVVTEFKSLEDGADDGTVNNALGRAKSQARYVVLDGRAAELTKVDAQHGLRRFRGGYWAHRLDGARILVAGSEDVVWLRKEE